jgi:acetone carboxylase, gamma subunit
MKNMKVAMTEYLRIDLDTEQWECRVCNHVIGSANLSYKQGMLVHDRDPREIHPPIIDPERYRFTFSPDPEWVRILEYYCPGCGTMVETEYAIPGHPPLHDMQPDLPALKAQWAARGAEEPTVGAEVLRTAAHGH